MKQSGGVETCWAHNPEVDGSKSSSASTFLLDFLAKLLHSNIFRIELLTAKTFNRHVTAMHNFVNLNDIITFSKHAS